MQRGFLRRSPCLKEKETGKPRSSGPGPPAGLTPTVTPTVVPRPNSNLNLDSGSSSDITARMANRLGKALLQAHYGKSNLRSILNPTPTLSAPPSVVIGRPTRRKALASEWNAWGDNLMTLIADSNLHSLRKRPNISYYRKVWKDCLLLPLDPSDLDLIILWAARCEILGVVGVPLWLHNREFLRMPFFMRRCSLIPKKLTSGSRRWQAAQRQQDSTPTTSVEFSPIGAGIVTTQSPPSSTLTGTSVLFSTPQVQDEAKTVKVAVQVLSLIHI